ncbi:MAG: DUF3413 domain-containing protein [Candidatus Delongbacteria bacterium]|nr:DUF3413 domain-containing protein [Candidatus Delongbacteria bacterium]MBN2835370.1 DUF3413 domain-containing protein [Candidatus Delongbacteria bacterium]
MKNKVYEIVLFGLIISIIASVCGLFYINEIEANLPIRIKSFIYSSLVGYLGGFSAVLTVGIALPFVFITRKLYKLIGVLVGTFVVVFLLSDILVYNKYKFHINHSILSMFFGPARKEVFDFSTTMWIWIWLGLLLTFMIIITFYMISASLVKRKIGKYIIIALSPLVIISFLYYNTVHMIADAKYDGTILRETSYFPLFSALTGKKILKSLNIIDYTKFKSDLPKISTSQNKKLNYPLNQLTFDNNITKKNIIFIVIESWRSDCMTKEITPNIFNFSKKTIIFNNHRSSGNSTRSGIFGMFYGINPLLWDTMMHGSISPILMNTLISNNYSIGIFGSAPLSSPELNKTVFSSIQNLRMGTEGEFGWQRDQNMTNDFSSWLVNKKEAPFFAFLFYDSSHAPYSISTDSDQTFQPFLEDVNFFEFNNDFDPLPYFNRYKNSLHNIDKQIGKVISLLEVNGDLDNSLVVIVGDHGEEFNDLHKNFWGHKSNFAQYQSAVPLLFYDKDLTPYTENKLTTHYDIPTTLLRDYFKCKNDLEDYTDGNSLFNLKTIEYNIVANYHTLGIVSSDRIHQMNQNGYFKLYDDKMNLQSDELIDNKLVFKVIKKLNRFNR